MTVYVVGVLGVLGACTGDGGGDAGVSTTAAPASTAVDEGSHAAPDSEAPETTGTTEPAALELGPLGETEVDLETDEGRVQIGDAQLPDSLPDDFPLPDDLVVQISSEEVADAGFSGASQVGFEELVALYRTGLADAGYEVNEDRFVEGVVAVFSFEGDGGDGSVVIGDAPGGGRSVIVTFET